MSRPALAACVAVLVLSGAARAQSIDAGGPDASLRAMTGSVVRLELDGEPPLEGKLMAFEEQWVTLALSSTEEIVSVPREKLLKLLAVEAPTPALGSGPL